MALQTAIDDEVLAMIKHQNDALERMRVAHESEISELRASNRALVMARDETATAMGELRARCWELEAKLEETKKNSAKVVESAMILARQHEAKAQEFKAKLEALVQ